MTEESKPARIGGVLGPNCLIILGKEQLKCPACSYTEDLYPSQPRNIYCPQCYDAFIGKNVPKLIKAE